MKKVISAKVIEKLLKEGGDPRSLPADIILTPAAKDIISNFQRSGSVKKSKKQPAPTVPNFEYTWKAGSDAKTPGAIDAFFHSPEINLLKERICEIGRRLYAKDFIDGNGGNITIRVGDDLVLCTPTLISKGYMTPDDLCLVDFKGNQLAGSRKQTSEVTTHIGIFKYQSKAKACVHAHPAYATAFAIASVEPPTCIIPEAELFLGKIGLAKYETPGTLENAEVIGKIGVDHQSIIMGNHGVITWGKDVEDAHWKMENTAMYCKTLWIASFLGNEINNIGGAKLKELLAIRNNLGMDDPRTGMRECELCDNDDFRPGVICKTSERMKNDKQAASLQTGDPEIEALINKLTDSILEQLKN
jgi:L-fuculose-phosphate aldolase